MDDDGDLILMRRFLSRYKPVFPNYVRKQARRRSSDKQCSQVGMDPFRLRFSTTKTAGSGTYVRRRPTGDLRNNHSNAAGFGVQVALIETVEIKLLVRLRIVLGELAGAQYQGQPHHLFWPQHVLVDHTLGQVALIDPW